MLKYITAVLGAVALAVIAPHARAQELKNPDQIAYVLKLLTHVQNDFGRQIDHKTNEADNQQTQPQIRHHCPPFCGQSVPRLMDTAD